MGDIIYNPEEASKGSFQSIKKFEALLVDVQREPSPWETKEGQVEKDVAKVYCEDVIILEMEEGTEEPDLTDDKFTFVMNYAKKDAEKPHKNTFFVAAFLESAKALAKARGNDGGTLQDLLGTRVVFEYKEVELFTHTNKDTGEKEPISGKNFVFALDDAGEEAPIEDHIRKLIVGKNKGNALRSLMSDGKAKRDQQWRQKLNNGTLAEELGLEIVDGVFTQNIDSESA